MCSVDIKQEYPRIDFTLISHDRLYLNISCSEIKQEYPRIDFTLISHEQDDIWAHYQVFLWCVGATNNNNSNINSDIRRSKMPSGHTTSFCRGENNEKKR
jgi:hypothetical protein